jgi:septal ring factor EnvC (AmiA/AmiB activator)
MTLKKIGGTNFAEKRLDPGPELVEEMMEVTEQPFYLYTFSHFLKHASDFLEKTVDTATIEEITGDELAQRERARADADNRKAVGDSKLETTIDKIEKNLEANRERFSKAADALSRVEANIEYLREKLRMPPVMSGASATKAG